ncbi:hypothetical protein EV188_106278 [Actinomycetospora succinea]|uniref:CdiI immunity protein domain-containing protein n=1 Tax=Actinomycetospora succinea TaxID=663603 RepID=A0A4V3D918_9PSEU|nr:contact-dependent growth inhibition system immunity protein [Actinomycetospora succinea]TDQ54129.1 hypothetical protein EV188_106278 [Actinomycetospora succinea]
MTGPRRSQLRTLFAAYLNQDFVDDYGSPSKAVGAYCRTASDEHRMTTAQEVHEILRTADGEDGARQAVAALALEYHPEAEGWQMRDWLAELERFLRDPDGPTRLDWPHEETDTSR